MTPNPYFEAREVWELQLVEDLYLPDRGLHFEQGFAAITYNPSMFFLSVWIVDIGQRAFCSPTHHPNGAVLKWGSYGLPPLSHECLVKLSALEAARSKAL